MASTPQHETKTDDHNETQQEQKRKKKNIEPKAERSRFIV